MAEPTMAEPTISGSILRCVQCNVALSISVSHCDYLKLHPAAIVIAPHYYLTVIAAHYHCGSLSLCLTVTVSPSLCLTIAVTHCRLHDIHTLIMQTTVSLVSRLHAV